MRLTATALALALALMGPQPGMAQDQPTETEPLTGDAGAYLAARIAAAESDFRSAAAWYTRALIADPANPALLEGAVVANMGVGNFDAAGKLATALSDLGIKSQAAYIALLVADAKRGDYAAILAGQHEGRAIGALLDGLVAAWAEAGNGQMSEALDGFDKIAAAQGLQVFGNYHKALALASVGDFEGADEILSRGDAEPIRLFRRGAIAHAQILSQLERHTDALKVLDDTFAPGQDPAIEAMKARLQAGEVLPFDIAMNADQGIAEVFYSMGTALNGEAENAYTLLYIRATSYLRPDHTEALLMSAGLLAAEGQHDLAVETYATVPADAPEHYLAEMGRAEALRGSGRMDEATEVLFALSKTYPNLLAVQMAYGDQLRRQERFADAAKVYDAAVALIGAPQPKDWVLFFSRGICHERAGNWEQAEADLRRALELSPDRPQVLNYLGYSYLEMNTNLDEALSLIERAVAAQPDSGYILDSLAWAYFRLGRYDDALEPMEQASLLEPVDPIVTDHLGDVYWAVGRSLEAQFQWRRALSYGPEEKDAERIRRKLEIGLDAVLEEEGTAPLAVENAEVNGG